MVELLKFSHNRDENFRKSCDDLRDTIDTFVDNDIPDEWHSYFSKRYQLPKDVISRQIKCFLEKSYDYINCNFDNKLLLRNIFKMAARHILFLLYVLLKSKRYTEKDDSYHDLIIEWVASDRELSRFSKLIRTFGSKNVLIVSTVPLRHSEFKIACRPTRKYYDRIQVLKVFFSELIYGLRLYLKLSRQLKVDMVPIASHLVNQYLYYSSIFKYNRSKYCIQERHYQTSAVKNFIFHKYEGIYSCCLQKNIIQLGSTGFYYDIDVFFALGKKTAERAFRYGARIDYVVPVGSLFMEHYYFNQNKNNVSKAKKYDVVYIGINVYKKSAINSYCTFMDDYYQTFKWLVRLTHDYSNIRIVVKHHVNNIIDKKEMQIISNDNIERVDNRLNSYQIATEAKCIVTFCSTMGYELMGHGFPVIFMDPGRRNIQILPEDDLIDRWRAITYEDFSKKVALFLSSEKKYVKTSQDDLCLNSEATSTRIHEWLSESKVRND